MVDKDKLAVNCGDLWLCGRSYLPMVADAFNKGSAKAGDTVAYDGGFARAGYVGVRTENDAMGPVQPVWVMARDELQRVMAQTAENIYQACDALVRVANVYAAADSEVATALHNIQQDYEHKSKTLHPGDPDYFRIEPDRGPQVPTGEMPR